MSPRRRRGRGGAMRTTATAAAAALLLPLLALLPAPVRANDDFGIFITPPRNGPNGFYDDNPAYQVGTTVDLRWQTGMRRYQLNIWQQWLNETRAVASGHTIVAKEADQGEPRGFAWKVSPYDLDLDISHVFFLGITEKGDLADGFTSHYFNITKDPVPTTSTTTTATPPATSNTNPPVSTPSEDPDGSSSDNDALKVGLGLGLGLGIPAIALVSFVAAFLVLRRRQVRPDHRPPPRPGPTAGDPLMDPMEQGHPGYGYGYLGATGSGGGGGGGGGGGAHYPSGYSPGTLPSYFTPSVTSGGYTPHIAQLDGTPKDPTTVKQTLPSELHGDTVQR